MSTIRNAKIRKIVIPVAGHGTRVLPATKSIPKEMLPVVDRPLIDYIIEEAREAGIEHFVFVTGRGKSAIEDYFDHAFELEMSLRVKGTSKKAILNEVERTRLPAGMASFTRQQTPAGLGHAIWCARDIIGDAPFAISLPDMIMSGQPACLRQMVDAYEESGGNLVAVEDVPPAEVNKYGIISPKNPISDVQSASKENASGRVDEGIKPDRNTNMSRYVAAGRLIEMDGMVEKPDIDDAPSTLMISGRYILQPEIFDILASTETGAGGEIQLTDAMAVLIETQKFHAYKFEGQTHDCGSKLGWLKANLAFAAMREDLAPDIRTYLDDVFPR